MIWWLVCLVMLFVQILMYQLCKGVAFCHGRRGKGGVGIQGACARRVGGEVAVEAGHGCGGAAARHQGLPR
jgi:hypothetical protein